MPVSGFAASNPAFSPNCDGTKDTTAFSVVTSDPHGPIAYTLSISGSSGANGRGEEELRLEVPQPTTIDDNNLAINAHDLASAPQPHRCRDFLTACMFFASRGKQPNPTTAKRYA